MIADAPLVPGLHVDNRVFRIWIHNPFCLAINYATDIRLVIEDARSTSLVAIECGRVPAATRRVGRRTSRA